MTAEIAILNRHAVALAADSAVTIGRQRAWKTANKLFSLSPANDIGIMIYGGGSFAGYSWEIIAKTFRENVGKRSFGTVGECGQEFLTYLRSGRFENDAFEDVNVLALFTDVLENVKDEVGEHKSKRAYKSRLMSVISNRIAYVAANYKDKVEDCTDRKQFLADYSDRIKQFTAEAFDCSITKNLLQVVGDLLYLVFRARIESPLSTGVVITGYGKDQFFPELIDYQVDGKHRECLRVWVGREKNLNEKGATSATVVPFAQSDMFQIFMEGIARNHLTFVEKTLVQVLNDKSDRLLRKLIPTPSARRAESAKQKKENEVIMQRFFREFARYIQSEMIQPVVGVISTLPKEEMAAMAEALVEITTLRRKVDSTVESVGGPTDVAIISKGDGLVWIKRKHYFDIQINQDFRLRKRFRHGDEDAG